MTLKARFKGDPVDNFHAGIPARDLTDQDWETMAPEEKQLVLASPLYNVLDRADSTEEDRNRHRSRLESMQDTPDTAEVAPMPDKSANMPQRSTGKEGK